MPLTPPSSRSSSQSSGYHSPVGSITADDGAMDGGEEVAAAKGPADCTNEEWWTHMVTKITAKSSNSRSARTKTVVVAVAVAVVVVVVVVVVVAVSSVVIVGVAGAPAVRSHFKHLRHFKHRTQPHAIQHHPTPTNVNNTTQRQPTSTNAI